MAAILQRTAATYDFFFSISSEGSACHKVYRRLIRRYFHGIGNLHRLRSTHTVYHIPGEKGEESLNEGQINYAGYKLLISNSSGSAREKMLTAHAYIALLDKNIITRHPAVSARGPITAI